MSKSWARNKYIDEYDTIGLLHVSQIRIRHVSIFHTFVPTLAHSADPNHSYFDWRHYIWTVDDGRILLRRNTIRRLPMKSKIRKHTWRQMTQIDSQDLSHRYSSENIEKKKKRLWQRCRGRKKDYDLPDQTYLNENEKKKQKTHANENSVICNLGFPPRNLCLAVCMSGAYQKFSLQRLKSSYTTHYLHADWCFPFHDK